MAGATRGLLFLRGHALIEAIDTAVDLIEPLTLILQLARCGLGLRQGLAGGAVSLLEAGFQRIDALADGGDLFAHERLGGAPTEPDRAEQPQRKQEFGRVSYHTEFQSFDDWNKQAEPARTDNRHPFGRAAYPFKRRTATVGTDEPVLDVDGPNVRVVAGSTGLRQAES